MAKKARCSELFALARARASTREASTADVVRQRHRQGHRESEFEFREFLSKIRKVRRARVLEGISDDKVVGRFTLHGGYLFLFLALFFSQWFRLRVSRR